MASSSRKGSRRLYTKRGRWYVDFRDYGDVGGGLESLIPAGERFATKERRTAVKLAKARLEELKAARRRGPAEPGVDLTRLGDFVDHHLVGEARETLKSEAHLAQLAQQLEFAVEHLGPETRLRDIRTTHVVEYMKKVAERGGAETQKKYLYALSKLFRRARAEEVVPAGHDPIGNMVNRPKASRAERAWLEVPDAALLLEAARLHRPRREDLGVPYAYPLVAAALLTGGRPSEVLRIRTSDLDFERDTIRLRGTKNDLATRSIPMWPQLKEILQAYLSGPDAPEGRYLFPSVDDPDQPLGSMKKLLAELALRAGLSGITPKVSRHTYCAARLQTTDNGAPVATYTVSGELGHGSAAMVQEIYGHLGTIRHRSEVVEYPLEKYMLQLKGRYERMVKLSRERNAHAPNLARRVSEEVERAVVEEGLLAPALGPRKIAAALAERGITVSASGVRWIWKRHGLTTAAERRAAGECGSRQRG